MFQTSFFSFQKFMPKVKKNLVPSKCLSNNNSKLPFETNLFNIQTNTNSQTNRNKRKLQLLKLKTTQGKFCHGDSSRSTLSSMSLHGFKRLLNKNCSKNTNMLFFYNAFMLDTRQLGTQLWRGYWGSRSLSFSSKG